MIRKVGEMAIDQIFPNPTVKQVIFQIRFPNLFYIESKIGDLQLMIMEEFPESALLFQRTAILVDMGATHKLEDIPDEFGKETGNKIWQFKSPKDYSLNVLSNSLDITSRYHKTYNLPGAAKFRDIIKFVLDNFISLVSIPIISRIGLRYIDECPIPVKDNAEFRKYYNSAFPLDRFNISEAIEMDFKTVVTRDNCNLRYIESLRQVGDNYRLILDFDGFKDDIEASEYLEVTDKLHEIIAEAYEDTIKEPVYQYMRQGGET